MMGSLCKGGTAFTEGGQHGADVSGQKVSEAFGSSSAAHAVAFIVSVCSGTRTM